MEEEKKCKHSSEGLCTFFENSDLKCNGEEEKNECACHIGTDTLNEFRFQFGKLNSKQTQSIWRI